MIRNVREIDILGVSHLQGADPGGGGGSLFGGPPNFI